MQFPRKRWLNIDVDDRAVDLIRHELRISRPLALLLVNRGVDSVESAKCFLEPLLKNISDPFSLPGMREAADIISNAIDEQKRIVVFGDYDADGVTSTALLVSVLRSLGAQKVQAFLPSRFDHGYGLTRAGLEECMEKYSPDVIVTVDCGVCSHEQVSEARKSGITMVITDHHDISGPVAEADAIVNPKLGDDKDAAQLAGVGVAFKLCHALIKVGLKKGSLEAAAVDLRQWLDLVAIGTVADVVPLTGENRILVAAGLARLNGRWGADSPGVAALKAVAGLKSRIATYHLGFGLSPRLNAVGRLGSAEDALHLLLAEDRRSADSLAAKLESANVERRGIEKAIVDEADKILESSFVADRDFGLVVAKEGWHQGTIGIVASRLCGRYGRPVCVVGIEGELARGSCRSIGELDMVKALQKCSDHLQAFGGHAMAAGFDIRTEDIPAFREQFNKVCVGVLAGSDLRRSQNVDAWIRLVEADDDLMTDIQTVKPFGIGNPTPVWGLSGVTVVGTPKRMGKNEAHMRLLLAEGGSQRDAVFFGVGDLSIPEGPLDVLFQLQVNEFRGKKRLQLKIEDLRPHKDG